MILPDKDKWNSPKDYVQYDPGFIAYLGLIFNPSRPVIDIGANIGKVAIFLASRTAELVTCYEPAPSTFQALINNTFDIKNIRCIQKAIGKSIGKSQFIGDGTVCAHLTDHTRGETVSVDVTTLDTEIDITDVGLIKIDVEGRELDVLLGAREVIQQFRPLLAIEMIDGHLKRGGSGRNEIFNFLYELGYIRAVNKYGMAETKNKSTGASDVFFFRIKIGMRRILVSDNRLLKNSEKEISEFEESQGQTTFA